MISALYSGKYIKERQTLPGKVEGTYMKKFIAILLTAVLAACMLPVSVLAAAPRDAAIHEVNILGLEAPVAGSTPEYSYTLYADETLGYHIVYQYWHDNTEGCDMFNEQTPFNENHLYSIGCLLCPLEGYYFAEDCVFMFDGNPDLADPEGFMPHPYFEGDWFVRSVAMTCESGNELIPGDVNGDGTVDVSDALLALRAAMGLVGLTDGQMEFADMNGDGECGVDDAVVILRWAMDLM